MYIKNWIRFPPSRQDPGGRICCQGWLAREEYIGSLHGIKSQYHFCINAFHAAGECRRQIKKLTKFVKNVKIVEFHDHIWYRNERCIQISTHMTSIGSLIREIAIEISEM